MKVVGVGLNKTGTTTLGQCLKYWKLNHISCSPQAFELMRAGKYDDLFTEYVEKYDSFEDWPWPLVYQEIDEKFPGSKFILTRRKDSESWYKSICKHADRTGSSRYRKYVYVSETPSEDKEKYIQVYEDHINSVRAYFQGRDEDFLEVCWEEGDGWGELSDFLGFENPDIPLPHANKNSAMASRLKSLVRRLVK